jgi:dCTP deaminase
MTIQCDYHLKKLLLCGLVSEPNMDLVNPASLDIRLGKKVLVEMAHGEWRAIELPEEGMKFEPGSFVLAQTYETFNVPNGYAMDLRLKSSTARAGWDHSLAFWVDPGWRGVLTMELRNVLRYHALVLRPGMRFAQAIVHRLSGLSEKPYAGRYQGAPEVEPAKSN